MLEEYLTQKTPTHTYTYSISPLDCRFKMDKLIRINELISNIYCRILMILLCQSIIHEKFSSHCDLDTTQNKTKEEFTELIRGACQIETHIEIKVNNGRPS